MKKKFRIKCYQMKLIFFSDNILYNIAKSKQQSFFPEIPLSPFPSGCLKEEPPYIPK